MKNKIYQICFVSKVGRSWNSRGDGLSDLVGKLLSLCRKYLLVPFHSEVICQEIAWILETNTWLSYRYEEVRHDHPASNSL